MTTEWEDIQIRLGNMAPKNIKRGPTDREYDEMGAQNVEFLEEAKRIVLERASLEDLEEFEDLEDEDVLEQYR